jgi:hypothetical protein
MKSIKMTDLVHELHEKYLEKIEGLYHNLLWKLLVDGVRDENPRKSALTLLAADGNAIGIADEDKSGYTPTGCWVKVPYDEAMEIVNDLNQKIFGLEPVEAFKIVLSSMRK